jgi:predicted dehydrogenase
MADSKPVRIAIIGCGAFSELYYAPLLLALQKEGEVEVVYLFDPDNRRVEILKGLFPSAFGSVDFSNESDQNIDLAIVVSPPRFHASQSISFLDRGIGVLCEKPMAASAAEAEHMVNAAKRSNAVLAIGLFRRFFATTRMIKTIIAEERLGRVKTFQVSEGGVFNWPAQSASFFQKSASQGGVLADLGVHVLDLLIHWFGMPDSVGYEDDATGGLEANCRLDLDYKNGVSGTVRLSRDTHLPNRTIIECEQGWVRSGAASADEMDIGFHGSADSLSGSIMNIGANGAQSYRSEPASNSPFAAQLRNVLGAVRGKERQLVSGDEGLLSMQLIDECYRKRGLMNMPWLAETEFTRAEHFLSQ